MEDTLNKTDLLKTMFLYASQNIKSYFVKAERMICNPHKLTKNEIILVLVVVCFFVDRNVRQ